MEIPQMGCHLILDFHNTKVDLNNFELLNNKFTQIIVESGATIETSNYKLFEPQGLSILYLLSESHFSIHTWPEHGACAIDFYHCGETAKLRMIKAEELLCDFLGWENCTGSMIVDRGTYNYALIKKDDNNSLLVKNYKLTNRKTSEIFKNKSISLNYFIKETITKQNIHLKEKKYNFNLNNRNLRMYLHNKKIKELKVNLSNFVTNNYKICKNQNLTFFKDKSKNINRNCVVNNSSGKAIIKKYLLYKNIRSKYVCRSIIVFQYIDLNKLIKITNSIDLKNFEINNNIFNYLFCFKFSRLDKNIIKYKGYNNKIFFINKESNSISKYSKNSYKNIYVINENLSNCSLLYYLINDNFMRIYGLNEFNNLLN